MAEDQREQAGVMTDNKPCEFCNETEGHAAECPYPNTLAGHSEAFKKACRDLGRLLWRDFQRVWKRGSR